MVRVFLGCSFLIQACLGSSVEKYDTTPGAGVRSVPRYAVREPATLECPSGHREVWVHDKEVDQDVVTCVRYP